MNMVEAVLLLAAGVGAGLVGSTAGLASLVSYPALLLLGLSPVTANVTNTVALIGSSIGSVARSRSELAGQAGDLRTWLPVGIVAGGAGAALLLTTPPGSFEVIVPFLIAGASVLMLAGPRIRRLQGRRNADSDRSSRLRPVWTLIALALCCGYGGYFGAAAGVILLAVLLLATDKPLPVANAVKNLLLGAANAVAAVVFAIFSDVRWWPVLPLGVGCLIGGALGPAIVRRVPPDALRWIIGLAGLGLAVRLWLS